MASIAAPGSSYPPNHNAPERTFGSLPRLSCAHKVHPNGIGVRSLKQEHFLRQWIAYLGLGIHDDTPGIQYVGGRNGPPIRPAPALPNAKLNHPVAVLACTFTSHRLVARAGHTFAPKRNRINLEKHALRATRHL